MGVNWVLNKSRYISIIREKQSKNNRKRKVTRKREKSGCTRGARPCATHHGQLMVGSVQPVPDLFRSAAFCLFSVLRLGPRILLMLGHFGPPLLSSLIHMALNFILSSITWLNSHESAIKTRKSRNKRNWRNRCVNHINIHLNPPKMNPKYPTNPMQK